MIKCLTKYLSPACLNIGVLLVSVASLAAALIGQYGFDLQPCILCLYQRIPFIAAIVFSLAGLAAYRVRVIPTLMLIFSTLAFFINGGIAMFHTGVERKWWTFDSTCTGNSDKSMSQMSADELVTHLMQTKVVPCDQPQWELFGLTMANYNVVYSIGCGVAVMLGIWLYRSRKMTP